MADRRTDRQLTSPLWLVRLVFLRGGHALAWEDELSEAMLCFMLSCLVLPTCLLRDTLLDTEGRRLFYRLVCFIVGTSLVELVWYYPGMLCRCTPYLLFLIRYYAEATHCTYCAALRCSSIVLARDSFSSKTQWKKRAKQNVPRIHTQFKIHTVDRATCIV